MTTKKTSRTIKSDRLENDQLKNQLARCLADFDNFRKRSLEREQELTKYQLEKILLELGPILDNFERALAHQPEPRTNNPWTQGLLATIKQFEAKLIGLGAQEIKPRPADRFDPRYHEAISYLSHPRLPADTIITVYQRGWQIGQRVAIPAKVTVSSGTQKTKQN